MFDNFRTFSCCRWLQSIFLCRYIGHCSTTWSMVSWLHPQTQSPSACLLIIASVLLSPTCPNLIFDMMFSSWLFLTVFLLPPTLLWILYKFLPVLSWSHMYCHNISDLVLNDTFNFCFTVLYNNIYFLFLYCLFCIFISQFIPLYTHVHWNPPKGNSDSWLLNKQTRLTHVSFLLHKRHTATHMWIRRRHRTHTHTHTNTHTQAWGRCECNLCL